MLGLVAALLSAVAFPAVAGAQPRYTPQITNSQDASAGEYPYMVSLQTEDGFAFCGGSVIAPDWVLTAGHCVDGSPIEVLIGTIDLSSGGERIVVDEQVVHPDYVGVEDGDDVALLHLSSPTSAPPVALADATTTDLEAPGTNVTLTGWGYADSDRTESPTILQEADMPVLGTAECRAAFDANDPADGSSAAYDEVSMLCAGEPELDADGGIDACQGDSGGPLVATEDGTRVQVGIVSWGPTCGQTPSAYTRVSTYIDFIEATMAGIEPEPEPTDDVLDNTTRIAGASRFATAADLATTRFAPGVAAAFVVTGLGFADALAAAPVAAALGAPVLLTPNDTLASETAGALEALSPQQIIVVGGSGAVSDSIVTELEGFTDGAVTRVAGNNRFETAAALSRSAFDDGSGGLVVLASGESFADALSGAAYAASPSPSPLLLTGRDELPDATVAELSRLQPDFVIVLGGTGVVSDAVVAELGAMGFDVDRIGGATRYETSAAIGALFGVAEEVIAATGTNFPDGLVAGALGLPLILVPPGEIPSTTSDAIEALGASSMLVLGGSGAISDQQALELDELVGG